MYQLKNLINRKVLIDPSDNVRAAEDFVLLLVHSHIVTAARYLYGIIPTNSVFDLAKSIVASYLMPPQPDATSKSPIADSVHAYALELVSLGLLWHGFHDCIKEGDGDRLMVYWKFLMVVFKASNRPNYGKESMRLLLLHTYLLSDRKRMQLTWSRFVNTKGPASCNIACDIHM